MYFKCLGFNSNDIISFEYLNQVVQNPFEVALQAMLGHNVILPYKKIDGIMITRYVPLRYLPDPINDIYAQKAMQWIIDNADVNSNGLYVWNYQFYTEFFNHKIYPPWKSAFGQAYVLFALLLWYMHTNQQIYKDMALGAAQALITPIKQGGLMNQLDDGLWFEELPPPAHTEIFNGHLAALLALMETQRILKTEKYASHILSGIHAFEQRLRYIDTGFWSAYDIPEKVNVFFQILPMDAGRPIYLKHISLYCGNEKRSIDLSLEDCFDLAAKNHIVGTDWGSVNESSYRMLNFGPSVQAAAVESGTRQNTYVRFSELPVMTPLLTVSFEVFCPYQTEASIAAVDQTGNWQNIASVSPLCFSSGYSNISFTIHTSVFFPPLTLLYHDYHIMLMEEILNIQHNQKMRILCDQLRRYKHRSKSSHSLISTVPRLQYIYFGVNEQCGCRCKMCDVGQRNRESALYANLMPTDGNENIDPDLVIKRCLEHEDLKCVHFNACEPTLWKPLADTVKKLKTSSSLRVNVTTNGINLKILPNLLESGLDELWISIDGPSQTHDEIRDTPGLFNKIKNSLLEHQEIISCYKKNGFKLYLACAITPLNYLHLCALAESTKDMGFDMLVFTHMNFVTKEMSDVHNALHKAYPTAPSSVSYEACMPNSINPYLLWLEISKLNLYCSSCGIPVDIVPKMDSLLDYEDFYIRPHITVGKARCTVPEATMEVNADGSCCVMSRCYRLDLGNIKNYTLRDIFHCWVLDTFRLRQRQTETLWPACKRCCGIMD